uniref:E3 ubiquitin-protein ligase RMA n=1 Tax=Kalanchoe fedtschenkoi TaxID=63787 RepID=A0A7N0T8N5_KALFE
MASEYNSLEHTHHQELNKEEESIEQWNSSSDTASRGLTCSSWSGFDCNICLEFVQDPVVTLCGHLYCWPCIYKWIHFNSVSNEESGQGPQCPVCKAQVSSAAVVPLYGRGRDLISSDPEASKCDLAIPERPSAPICSDMSVGSARQLNQHNHEQRQGQFHPQYIPYTTTFSVPRLGVTNSIQPLIDIFGEMVYSRLFGQSITRAYNHSNSYNVAEAYTPRVRRQLMHADQSLGRLCFFVLCGMILCLLLF